MSMNNSVELPKDTWVGIHTSKTYFKALIKGTYVEGFWAEVHKTDWSKSAKGESKTFETKAVATFFPWGNVISIEVL